MLPKPDHPEPEPRPDPRPDPESPTHARREERPPLPSPSFALADLRCLPPAGLQEIASEAGLAAIDGLSHPALVFALQCHLVGPDAVGHGEGLLELRPEGFGFLRAPDHLGEPGADDIYISPAQVRALRLRSGQQVAGLIRRPRAGEHYFAMVQVDSVDGEPADHRPLRVPFADLRPVLPHRRLPLLPTGAPPWLRDLDRLAPIGLGQRVVITAPPGSRRLEVLRDLARAARTARTAITAATTSGTTAPPLEILSLLVDQRPEELAAFRSQPDVHATTFDQPAERHVEAMATVLHRVRRLVELGRDVVLFVDGLTQLVRACNTALPHSGKILSAGLDAQALHRPKELFAAARQTEEGASLTIFATLRVATGSPIEDAIAGELGDRGNATIALRGEAGRPGARGSGLPALDPARTRTRWEDLLREPRQRG